MRLTFARVGERIPMSYLTTRRSTTWTRHNDRVAYHPHEPFACWVLPQSQHS